MMHDEHARSYILIEAEAGSIGSILDSLRDLPGVETADPVTGPYDIVVVASTEHQRDIGRLVMNNIHAITGIKRTVTCHVI